MPQSKKLCFVITREGLGWVTQKEANAVSLWNNNLGYQGILEFSVCTYIVEVKATALYLDIWDSLW
jgi:hypothetical protein